MSSPPAAVCYQCGQPLEGVCVFCGKFFCYLHGGPGMRLCRRHYLITTLVSFAVVLALALGTMTAAFLHAAR